MTHTDAISAQYRRQQDAWQDFFTTRCQYGDRSHKTCSAYERWLNACHDLITVLDPVLFDEELRNKKSFSFAPKEGAREHAPA